VQRQRQQDNSRFGVSGLQQVQICVPLIANDLQVHRAHKPVTLLQTKSVKHSRKRLSTLPHVKQRTGMIIALQARRADPRLQGLAALLFGGPQRRRDV